MASVFSFFRNSWYKRAARLEADREVNLPARPYRRGKAIVLNQYGLASFFALSVMVLFCINYSSNAGLICACLLFLTWVCAILANHWIMSRISLMHVSILPGDEDHPGDVEILWQINTSARPVFWMTVDGQVARVVFDENGQARVRWTPLPRPMGRYVFPSIRMSTSWPMSIGFSWFVLRPALDVVIAPAASIGTGNGGESGEASSNSLAISGDPEGIRPRNERDPSSRWAWKQTLRQGRPMTYEYTQEGHEVARIVWEDNLEAPLALRKISSDIHTAVRSNRPFQVFHPWGQSQVLTGLRPALVQLCGLTQKALPRTQWGPGVPFTSQGLLSRILAWPRKGRPA